MSTLRFGPASTTLALSDSAALAFPAIVRAQETVSAPSLEPVITVIGDRIRLDSIPGSLAQVRECAGRLMQFAKTTGTPTVVVGQVTKYGGLAGPKTLEHLFSV